MSAEILGAIGKGIGAGLDYATARANRNAQMSQAHQNELNQIKFAKNAISWKVEDAKRAGIHPLFALGASTSGYSPVSIGSLPDSNLAAAFGSMGADLGTAVSKGMPREGVASAFTKTAQELQLEGMQLDNDIKRAKLASDVAKVTQPGAAAGAVPPEVGPFRVPEAKKSEDRQPLMLMGRRITTDPGTSPAKAVEDQLGDEILSPGFLWNLPGMLRANIGNMSFKDMMRAIDNATRINRFWK